MGEGEGKENNGEMEKEEGKGNNGEMGEGAGKEMEVREKWGGGEKRGRKV